MNAQVPSESFEQLVATLPSEILLTEREHGELVILARSADREAERAKQGDESNLLGATMSRFLVRLAELLGTSDPGAAQQIVAELRATIAEADAAAVERFRRDNEATP